MQRRQTASEGWNTWPKYSTDRDCKVSSKVQCVTGGAICERKARNPFQKLSSFAGECQTPEHGTESCL